MYDQMIFFTRQKLCSVVMDVLVLVAASFCWFCWRRVTVTFLPRTPQQAEAALASPPPPSAAAAASPAVEPTATLAGTNPEEPPGTPQADSLNSPVPVPDPQPEPELAQPPTHDPHQLLPPGPDPKVPAQPEAGPAPGLFRPGSAQLSLFFNLACVYHSFL